MASRRTTPNRFSAQQATDTSSVLSGIQQELDPRFTKGFVKRNLAPYPGLPKQPKAYRKKSDAALRKLATNAVFKERHIVPRRPRRKKAATK